MNNLVENTRINAEVELEYMTLEEKLNEFKAEGKQEQAIETATKMLLVGNYSMNQIIKLSSLSEKEIEELRLKLKDRVS